MDGSGDPGKWPLKGSRKPTKIDADKWPQIVVEPALKTAVETVPPTPVSLKEQGGGGINEGQPNLYRVLHSFMDHVFVPLLAYTDNSYLCYAYFKGI